MDRRDEPGGRPRLAVLGVAELTPAERGEIVALCSAAFDEDFGNLFEVLSASSVHLLARVGEELVSHACWSTRWLQPGGLAPLRTAYVDAMATSPAHQGHGLGSLVMRRLAEEIRGYEIGGLCPARLAFYERLGWERWRGPLALRTAEGLRHTPDETAMILRTPRTPPLDLDALLTIEWRAWEPW